MKRSILFLVLVLLAVPAAAQETYSVGPVSAGNVTTLTRIVRGWNVETCLKWGKVAGCADTGAAGTCVAAGAAGGSACTPAQARAVDARIYPLTFAGREEFVIFAIAQAQFQEMAAKLPAISKQAYCSWFSLQTQAVQDTECTKIGLSAGCSCPAQ